MFECKGLFCSYHHHHHHHAQHHVQYNHCLTSKLDWTVRIAFLFGFTWSSDLVQFAVFFFFPPFFPRTSSSARISRADSVISARLTLVHNRVSNYWKGFDFWKTHENQNWVKNKNIFAWHLFIDFESRLQHRANNKRKAFHRTNRVVRLIGIQLYNVTGNQKWIPW